MKNVLITGVTRGIGRGIAERFLKEGYVLYGTFFSHKDEAEQLIKKYGSDKVKIYGPYDFTDFTQSQKLVNDLKNVEFDSIICSAGVFSENDDFNCFDINEFISIMNCNFYTPLIISIGLKDNIKKNGSIVIMSSNDAFPGAFSSLSYTISKAAVQSLMKCLSVNFGQKNVRVNSVAPGAINTAMNTDEQMVISPYFSPIARVGQPVDVANVVFFLASEEAGFISGENITIDGGYNIESILLKSEADPNLSLLLRTFIGSPNFIQILNDYADKNGIERHNNE